MRLNRVQIKNFRSIEDVTVEFEPTCRVLVGINESGKSNILKALALLSNDYKPVRKDDVREALPDEDPIEKSYVRFIFKLEKNESDELLKIVSSKIATTAKNPEMATSGTKKYSIKEFCATREEGIYTTNILTEQKFFTYWSMDSKFNLSDGWKKPTSSCPPDFSVELKGQKYVLSQYNLIRVADFGEIPEGYLEQAVIDDFISLVGNSIVGIVKENLPDILFWKYDDNYLLPNSIKMDDFSNNPDICVPLKNMFTLAGTEHIKASLDEKRKGSNNQLQNYLTSIAQKTTSHFKSVWKEYKNIEFSLQLNADEIVPGIKEKNTHDFSRRSDGFKRFVTFLLMISVNVKTASIKNTLLLIDEPEMSLHPAGARYLRDELIKISKTNYVIYSTHSIFMIDSGDIDRHYIVQKDNEITSLESAGASNIADEEVLFNALGHTIFSILKEKNILFEGWNDKQLFKVALENASADVKKKYKDVSMCHAKGVKSMKTITPMIELANRACLIISDSDAPAKELQKQYRQEKGFGEWKHYQDIDSTIEAVTGEDFLKNSFIVTQVNSVMSSSNLPAFVETILPPKKDKINAIQGWLTTNGMTTSQAKDKLTEIKNSIFENLKYQNIDDDYKKLLKGIIL